MLTEWAGPGKLSGHVVIVEIDEKSLGQFGRWPWSRGLVGQLSRSILDHGAATVALDLMFPQESGRTDDEVLADAVSGKPVIVGYAFKFDGEDARSLPCPVRSLPLALIGPNQSRGAAFFHATGAVCSAPAISGAASGSGFLNAVPDRDGTMRHVPLVIEYRNRYYPSLALATLNLYRHVSTMQLSHDALGAWRLRLDRQAIPLEGRSSLRLRFRGARRWFPYVSASDVLAGRAPEDLLRGRIAIVGGSALGIQNPVPTPADPLFPDVEIQATAIDNLLRGDSFRRPGDAQFCELALAILAGAISTFLLARSRSLWGAPATLGLAAGIWAGCAVVLSSSGMLFSPLPATAVLVCNLTVLTLFNLLQERKRADRTQQQLAATTQHSREVMRESESRYRRLVENVNDAIIMDDVEGRLVFANRRFREWFGLREGDILNIVLEHYVAPEWRVEMRGRHDRRMQGEKVPDSFEFEGIRSDGTRIWIEALVTTVEEDGRIVGSQAAMRDTTERKRMEAQYLQAQKMESLGRLAGGVAHDFNNLLTIIIGYSRLLLGQLNQHDPIRDSLEEIQNAAERAARLTQQLLAFSRKQVLQPRALDLNRVVGEMRPMLARLVGEDVEVCIQLHAEAATICADPHQWEQAIMNLVVNSRDAMPRGGKLSIQTAVVEWDENHARLHPGAQAGPYVVLAVGDTGVGMTEDTRQHIFEPFFTTKEIGKGTGLGLSMIQGIVEQSGGYIEVNSELEHGTTFQIYMPRVEDAPTDSGKLEAVPVTGGLETVLVVEDQAEVRKYTAAALEAHGYRVVQAGNAAEALLLCERERERIDLVLTDVVMPNLSGRELADILGKRWPGIKVLFMSGYTDDAIVTHGVLRNDAEFIQKPFSPDQLAIKVRQVLTAPDRRARILVAGGDAGVCSLRKVLEDRGYEVTESPNGEQALKEAMAGGVDLVISDLAMPDQVGMDTVRALHDKGGDIGIIALSDELGGQLLELARTLGAQAVLSKPVSADLLLAKVAEVLKPRH